MTTLGPARRTPLCGAWWRSDLWAPRIRAPSQCVQKAPRPQLPFQALPKISNTRPMLPRAFPRRPRSTQRHPRGLPRTTQRTDFGLLSRLLAPQQPRFYLRNSRILTCSSLLLQAPSLCSEKLSDQPLGGQKCSPRCSRGCPRSSPKPSFDALGALSGVSGATGSLQQAPSEPLDCSKPPSQAARSLSELLWHNLGLLSKLLAPLKPRLRNSIIPTFLL